MKKAILLSLLLTILFVSVYAQIEDSEIISVSLINQNPDPARAGEIVELRLRVENLGGKEANDLVLELNPKYPFSKIPGENYVQTIRTLSSYQQADDSVIIKFKVRVDKNAVKGINEIELKEGRAGSTTYATRKFNIEIRAKEFAQIIYVDKAKLDPGKETKMTFTITNIGNSPLQNMVFSWGEEDGIILPVFSDDTKYVKYLDVDESTDLVYTVVADVNAVPGLYQLNLKLKFEAENGTSKEINTRAGVFVGGETDFDVTFSESSAGQTSLSVANIGNNPALSVTVRIPEQENFRVTGSTSSIIGNLDKGDYTIVSFQITQGSGFGSPTEDREGFRREELTEEQRQQLRQRFSQGGGNNLNVVIEYTDTTGVRRTLEKIVPIQFRSSATSSEVEHAGPGGQFQAGRQSLWKNPLVIIALVVIVGGSFYYRKRKSKVSKKK